MFKIVIKILNLLFGSSNRNNHKKEDIILKEIPKKEFKEQLKKEEEDGKLDADQDDIILPEKEPKSSIKHPNIKNHYLPKGEYFSDSTEKSWLFLHHTLGWHDPFAVIDSWSRDTRGKVGTEYVIGGQSIRGNKDFDGRLLKAIPGDGWAWHLGIGRNKLHSTSIGIELCNFGPLTKGGYYKKVNNKKTWIEKRKNHFYSYTGVEVKFTQVCELDKEFKGYKYWHDYSDEQIITLRKLLIKLSVDHGIDITKGLVELINKQGAYKAFDILSISKVSKNPGLYSHSNVKSYKSDVYPSPKLVNMLKSLEV